jgi:NAD(P)H dehydrogenase (quinone)
MYALTGASGQLGRLVVQHLLTLVPADQIIATTRNPQNLADLTAKGIVVRHTDFTDPATLPTAFAGASRLLIISTDTVGQRVEQHRAAIEAASTVGVSHITYTSAPEADANSSSPIQREHGLTEAALASSGVQWTALRNNYYAEILPDILHAFLVGEQLLIPEGHVKPAWITREDCARTAAFVLADKTTITGPIDLTGPEALGFADLAQRWSNLTGHKVTPHILPDEELVTQLLAKGLSEEAATGVVGIAVWVTRVGHTIVTDTVERVTGTKASPVDVVLRSLALV